MVKVLYFARLREVFGCDGEEVALPDGVCDVAGFTGTLRARGEPWASELAAGRAYRVAVNHDMAGADTAVRDGDEIAIFPPVTGG